MPSQTRKDRQVTAEIHAMKHASDKAGRYSKSLYTDDALESCTQQAGVIRALWKSLTTPWQDGQRILLAGARIEFQEKLNVEVAEFYKRADATSTAEAFQRHLDAAQRDRNGMFRRDDYPVDHVAFRRGFLVTVDYLPLPDASHVLLDCAEDEIRVVMESTAAKIAAAEREAQEHLKEQMTEPLQNMLAQLANYEKKKLNGDRTRLCDSLVENIADIAKRAGILNITGNAKLAEVAADLDRLAGKTNVEVLKNSTHARRTTADMAKNILAKLGSV